MQKRILVTGGAGFLGSHLCARLLEASICAVACVDNYFTGSRVNIELPHRHTAGFEVMRHDITFPLYVEVDLRSTISPARHRPSTTSSIRSKPPRPMSWAQSICSGWRNAVVRAFCKPPPAECMADPDVHPQPEG